MSFLSFLRKLRHQLQARVGRNGGRKASRKPRRRSTTLGVEALECRITPITNQWTGGGAGNFNWSNGANWSQGVPGANQDLVFPGGVPSASLTNTNNINGLVVKSITFSGSGYTLNAAPAGGSIV